MNFLHNFKTIRNELKNYSNKVNLIVVTKNQSFEKISHLIAEGQKDFGENKVQEAVEKWTDIKKNNKNLKLHLIGKLQSNKVKFVSSLFDYIHSLDNEKLAKIFSDLEKTSKKNLKYFIQVNIGNENQKSGVRVDQVEDFVKFCKELKLNIIGLMCIPPINSDPEKFFLRMKFLKQKTLKLKN